MLLRTRSMGIVVVILGLLASIVATSSVALAAAPPSPIVAGFDTISNVSINGVPGTQLTVAPGADVSLTASWSDYHPTYCPGCIDFLAVAFQGSAQPAGCLENYGYTGASGTNTVDLGPAPTTPGTYNVIAEYLLVYYCSQNWSPSGIFVGAGGPYSGTEGSAVSLGGATVVPVVIAQIIVGSPSAENPVTTTWSSSANAGTDGTCVFADPTNPTTSVSCTDDGSYTLTLTVAEGPSYTVGSTAQLTVGNAAISVGPISGLPTAQIPLNTTVNAGATFSDPGTGDTHVATWNWGDGTTSTGAVDESTGSVTGSHTYATSGTFTVTLTVSDGDTPPGSGQSMAQVVVNALPTANAAGPYTDQEGTAVALSNATASDADGDSLTYAWSIAGGPADAVCTFSSTTTLQPSVTCNDEGTYTLTLSVSDGVNPAVASTAQLTVTNAPIAVNPITGLPTAPVAVNSTVNASATFTDPGTGDAHTATWNWGDGTTSSGTVTETLGTGTGSVSGSHTYAAAGVYTVSLTVDDGDNNPTSTMYQYVVVYDPSAGFVTGGGWITSPAGAYTADPSLTGKATFGFVSKYQKGASVPTGNTEFQFQAGTLDFHSTSYQWLVVNQGGTNAQFKGTGTINGAGSYTFMLWATSGSPDTFRIQITDDNNAGAIVYDNGVLPPIGGGAIVIHSGS